MRHLKTVSKTPAYAVELPSALCDLKARLANFMEANLNIECPCYADKCADQ